MGKKVKLLNIHLRAHKVLLDKAWDSVGKEKEGMIEDRRGKHRPHLNKYAIDVINEVATCLTQSIS